MNISALRSWRPLSYNAKRHSHDTSNDSGSRNNQVLIENLSVSGTNPIAIDANGNTKLANSPMYRWSFWIFGNIVPPGDYQAGQSLPTSWLIFPTQARVSGLRKSVSKAEEELPILGRRRRDGSPRQRRRSGRMVRRWEACIGNLGQMMAPWA